MNKTRTDLSDLRRRLGLSQADVAEELGTTQPGVLKIERSRDPRLSTIRRYLAGLAAAAKTKVELTLRVVVGDDNVELTTPELVGEVDQATERTDWRLRAWDDPALEQRWRDENVIAISQDELGDLTTWPGEDGLRRRLEVAFDALGDPRSPQAYGTFVRYWRSFCLDMQPGDRVAVPLAGRRVGIAEIVGPYEYRPDEEEPKMRHIRRVRWLAQCDRADLDEQLRRVVNAPGTVCQIKKGNLAAFS